MYSNPYCETPALTEGHPHSKKYSLRRRYQNPLREQLDRSKYLRQEEGSLLQATGGEWELRRGVQEGMGQGFNCMQSAQKILDFNLAASVSLKHHTKTLSTTPSTYQHPALARPLLMKESVSSSKEELQPSQTKSLKTAVSHKLSHNSSRQGGERLRTENNSQPLSTVNYGLYDDYSQGERRGKVSLKNTNKFSSQSKSQLLICLKYSDLKQPIGSHNNNKPARHSHTLQQAMNSQTTLGKYLCSTIKSPKGGCQCNPKCIWMDRWLTSIPQNESFPPQPPLSPTEWESTLRQIEKDLPRTQPEHPTFQMTWYINCMREVLVGYARADGEVGYVQGMNFIAAALVYHAHSSEEALRVMQKLMRGQGFRKIVLKDLAMSHLVSRRCVYELKRLAFDLYAHLVSQEVQVEVFITSWYFSLLGTFVPLASMHLIIDKFLRSQFTGLNEIILTLLIYLKSTLLGLYEHSLMMAFSGQQISLAASKINWQELVARSDHLLLPPLPI